MYRSPSTDDRVYNCLSMAMGEIQSVDPKSSFCFMGDFNCHHSEWLGSQITNANGVVAFDFATLTDCSQLVRGPTHRGCGILKWALTDVPDLCQDSVGSSVGRSDHSALFLTLKLVEPAPHFDLTFPCFQEWTGGVFVMHSLPLGGALFLSPLNDWGLG